MGDEDRVSRLRRNFRRLLIPFIGHVCPLIPVDLSPLRRRSLLHPLSSVPHLQLPPSLRLLSPHP